MVDVESVSARIDRLGALLAELDAISQGGHAAYLAQTRTRLAAERALQLAIQVCIDIGAHLISELGLKTPEDYRGVFHSLVEAGLQQGLAERLATAASMRNVLVHGYVDVDEEVIWAALAQLDDLREFARFAEQAAQRS